MSAPSIADLRAELTRVRAMQTDWMSRGSPEQEGDVIRALVATAEAKLAAAIANAPADPNAPPDEPPAHMLPPDQDPWANTLPDAPQPSPIAHAHADKVARKRSQNKPPRPARSSRDVLDKETDARFWAQMHYKVGQKLDPNNAADRAMVKAWLDIFHKVEAEDMTGHLVTTYDHPEVAKLLEDAKHARQAAEGHYEQAHDPWADKATVDQRVKDAHDANKASKDAASKAAAYQPPTVSPQVAQTSVDDAHRAVGQQPPPSTVPGRGHLSWSQPGAHPSHPDLATPNAATQPTPASPSDKLANANAEDAAKRAAEAHAHETAKDQGGSFPKFGEGKPDSDKPKKGLSTIVKVALGLLGVGAVGGLGYAMFGRGGSRPATKSSRARPRKRRSAPARRPSSPPWAAGPPGGI